MQHPHIEAAGGRSSSPGRSAPDEREPVISSPPSTSVISQLAAELSPAGPDSPR